MRRCMVIAFIVNGALHLPSQAQSDSCFRPREPNIPTGSAIEQYVMETARREVEDYNNRMRDYTRCMTNEANDAIAEQNRIVEEWNRAVRRFNSRQ